MTDMRYKELAQVVPTGRRGDGFLGTATNDRHADPKSTRCALGNISIATASRRPGPGALAVVTVGEVTRPGCGDVAR